MSATLELVKLLDGGNTCLYRLQVGGETGVNGAGFEVASRSFQEAPEGLPAETTTTSSGASDGAVVAVVQPKSIAEVLGVRVGDWVGLKEDDGTVQLACFETAANMIQEGHSTVILLRKFPAVVETHIESDSPTNVEGIVWA